MIVSVTLLGAIGGDGIHLSRVSLDGWDVILAATPVVWLRDKQSDRYRKRACLMRQLVMQCHRRRANEGGDGWFLQ